MSSPWPHSSSCRHSLSSAPASAQARAAPRSSSIAPGAANAAGATWPPAATEPRVAATTNELALLDNARVRNARPRNDPSAYRVRLARTGDVLDPTRLDRNEEQDVQAPRPDGVEGEQVTREDRVSVVAQERPPVRGDTLRRRRDGSAGAHVAHQRRRNRDPE